MNEHLINEILDGADPGQLIEDLLGEYIRGTARRPRKRRFARKGAAFDPYTGKRKDPTRRRKARMVARRYRAKRRTATRKLHRSAVGKIMHRRVGKLVARIRRRK